MQAEQVATRQLRQRWRITVRIAICHSHNRGNQEAFESKPCPQRKLFSTAHKGHCSVGYGHANSREGQRSDTPHVHSERRQQYFSKALGIAQRSK